MPHPFENLIKPSERSSSWIAAILCRTVIRILVMAVGGGILLTGCTTAPSWHESLGIEEFAQSATVESGLESPVDLPHVPPDAPRAGYRVAPQDQLNITVWGSKELWSAITAQGEQTTQTLLVQDDGTIVLPLLKGIRVEGLTLSEVLAKVAQGYRSTLGETVQVDGKISIYRSKSILLDGAFNHSGIAYLSPELRTLADTVSGFGAGLSPEADITRGVLYRGGKQYRINWKKAQESEGDLMAIEMRNGDRLFFPSRSKGLYYVFGEVVSQGAFQIPPDGVTVLQGLAQAKGPAVSSGNMEAIFLIRGEGKTAKSAKVYRLSLKDLAEYGDLQLSPGDRLIVPPTGLATWDRTLRQLIPFFSSTILIRTQITPN
jgi:polysaccharide export outer membrane protein